MRLTCLICCAKVFDCFLVVVFHIVVEDSISNYLLVSILYPCYDVIF